MSTTDPLSLPPGPAEDGPAALVPVPEPGSLAIRPEVALAVVTETLARATRALDATWEPKREALFRRHQAFRVAHQEDVDRLYRQLNASTGVCHQCGAPMTRPGGACSRECAEAAAEIARTRLAQRETEQAAAHDQEQAALTSAAQAEAKAGEVQALQVLSRLTLTAARAASGEEYRAALAACDVNDRYALRLALHGGPVSGSDRMRRVWKAEATSRRLDEALDRLLQRERDARVALAGGPPRRHCSTCLMPVIEDMPWCSKQCQTLDEAGKTYVAAWVPGLFRCEWCRLYFQVPDPDAAGIHDAASFCSRACLEASPVDLEDEDHVGMDFSTVTILPPPPSSVAGRQRAFASYIQRFIERQGRREDPALRAASRPIALPAPAPLAVLKGLLAERLGSHPSLVVRPADLVDDLAPRLGSKPNAETVGGWLRGLGAQPLGKDRRGARYLVSPDHLQS